MKTVNSIRRKHLLTIHFTSGEDIFDYSNIIDRTFVLLDDLSALARSMDSKYLNALFSLVQDNFGYHVHIITNWLPTFNQDTFNQKNRLRIDRKPVIEIIEKNGFIMDNPLEGIKPITFNPDYVESYVIHQPKDNQNVVYTDRYFSKHFSPVHSERIVHSYSSSAECSFFDRPKKSASITSTIIFSISLFTISIELLHFLLTIISLIRMLL